MLTFKIITEYLEVQNHTIVEKNVEAFSTSSFDPNNLMISHIPDEFYRIPIEKYKELNEKGQTKFTFTKTVTVEVKKSEIL